MRTIKTLAISASPRKFKNTYALLSETLKGCESVGSEVELISVSGLDMNPCVGCSMCQKKGKCHIDDGISVVLNKMQAADVILIGTPVFFYNVTAQCKMLIDRSYAVQPLNGNKVGGIVVSAASMGSSAALNTLEMFFTVQGITSAGYVSSLGDPEENIKGMKSAYDLGIKSVKMAEALKDAPQCFGMHNHYAYGTHTK